MTLYGWLSAVDRPRGPNGSNRRLCPARMLLQKAAYSQTCWRRETCIISAKVTRLGADTVIAAHRIASFPG